MINAIITALMAGIALVGGYLYIEDNNLGATAFPTSIDTLTNPTATDRTNVVSHADQHANANDAIEAIQTKVGVDGSGVTSTLSYKLSGVTGSDKAVSLTGSETLTNKVITAPTITNGTLSTTSLATSTLTGVTTITGTTTINASTTELAINLNLGTVGDIFYRDASGYLERLGIGSSGEVLKVSAGLPSWEVDTVSGGVKVRAYATTSQTLSTSFEKLNFAEEYDTGADFTAGTFTAPADGYYDISSRVVHNFVRAIDLSIYVNGAASSTNTNSANDADMNRYIADTLYLETGDTVNIYAKYQGGATSVTVTSGITNTIFIIKQL